MLPDEATNEFNKAVPRDFRIIGYKNIESNLCDEQVFRTWSNSIGVLTWKYTLKHIYK